MKSSKRKAKVTSLIPLRYQNSISRLRLAFGKYHRYIDQQVMSTYKSHDTQLGNESPVSRPKYIPCTTSNKNSGKNDSSKQVKLEITAKEKSKLTSQIFELEIQTTS